MPIARLQNRLPQSINNANEKPTLQIKAELLKTDLVFKHAGSQIQVKGNKI